MAGEHVAHDVGGARRVAASLEGDGAEGLNQRVVGAERGAEVEFDKGVVVSALIHEDARAVVADDDALRRVEAQHPVVALERLFVLAGEAVERGLDELHAGVVGGLLGENLDPRARLLPLAAREVDEDHVEPRFEQLRVEGERALEGDFGALVVFGAAEALDDEVGVGRAEGAVGEGEFGVERDGAWKCSMEASESSRASVW